jgi:hypothetical protein
LPGSEPPSNADEVLGLAGRFARAGGVDGLADDLAGDRRIFLEVSSQRFVDGGFDHALHFTVAQLGLGLTLELRIADLHADDRREPFADIVSGEGFRLFLQQIVGVGVRVDGAGQRGLEADQMGAAFLRVDVVREGKQVFRVAVVVLERNLQNHFGLFDLHVDRLVQRGFRFVQMLDEGNDAALVQKDLLFDRLFALVAQRDLQPFVEERQFAETLRQHVEAELQRFEDLAVRFEPHFCPAALGFPGAFQRRARLAALVTLLEDLAILPDFQLQPFRQRVDYGNADAMQAARHGIGALFEFAAGVQHGQRDFGCGFLLGRMHAGGDAAPVVDDGDAAVDVDGDLDRFAEARHMFVDAVVHHLVDQVVQAIDARAADVHGRALPHRIEAFENLDLVGAVTVGLRLVDRFVVGHPSPKF